MKNTYSRNGLYLLVLFHQLTMCRVAALGMLDVKLMWLLISTGIAYENQ